MKTLFVSALFAAAVAISAVSGCSSDNTNTLVTDASGSVPQGGACGQTADCEAELTCAYPVLDAGSTCPKEGVCVALGPFTVETICPCGSKVFASAEVTPSYSSLPLGGTGCTNAPVGDGGSTTTTDSGSTSTPVDSGSTSTPKDSGSSAPTDSGSGGSKTGG